MVDQGSGRYGHEVAGVSKDNLCGVTLHWLADHSSVLADCGNGGIGHTLGIYGSVWVEVGLAKVNGRKVELVGLADCIKLKIWHGGGGHGVGREEDWCVGGVDKAGS